MKTIKSLIVSKSTLEIAKIQLSKPMMTIGRSPLSDVVLRAPGINPVHFLAEWIGSGKFDPSHGEWTVMDISAHAGETKQGVILTEKPVEFSGYLFKCTEEAFDAKEQIGGTIHSNIGDLVDAASDPLVELIQIREDCGAIEEVHHLKMPKYSKLQKSPLAAVPQFDLEWRKASQLVLNLNRLPDAEVFNKGQRLKAEGTYALTTNDIFQIRWKGLDLFARFVNKIDPPRVPLPKQNRLLRWLSLSGALLSILILLIAHYTQVQPEEVPPQRVARIEIREVAAPTPAKPPEETVEIRPDPAPPKAAPKEIATAAKVRAGKAAAPSFVSKQVVAPRVGFNSPAKPADVNKIGILGALSRSSVKKSAGVRADMVLNNGIVTQSVSGTTGEIILSNAPTDLGVGKTAGSKEGTGPGLQAASTTLRSNTRSGESGGPIAAQGGAASGFSLGSSVNGKGSGVAGGAGIGTMDGSSFAVSGGGLDRETVRKIIAGYRSQIRTCYERALLASTSLNGRIVYEWSINPSGSVYSARVLSSTLQPSGLQSCVLEIVDKMVFPAAQNGRATKVIYPFLFQGKV